MSHKEAFVLLHEYAVGALNNEELRLVDSHLATGCPECVAELREINNSLVLLAEADGLVDPPEQLREAVLSKAFEETQVGPISVAPRSIRPPGMQRSLGRIVAGLAIAASLAFFVLGLPWLVGRPDPAVQEEAAAGTSERRGAEVRLVSLSLPAAERNWLKHVVFDSLSGELHVWVLNRDTDGEAVATHVDVLDAAGANVITAPLKAGDGVAGAVIFAPNLPNEGTLVVRSGPNESARGAILESSDFELR